MTEQEAYKILAKYTVLKLVEPFERAHIDWFKSDEDDRPFKEFVDKHFDEYFVFKQ